MLRDFTVRPVRFDVDTPQPRHAENALDMYRTGMEDRAVQDQGFLRKQVGGALASGESPLAAAQVAFAGGDIQAGIDLQSLPRDQLIALMEWLPRAAKGTDTPEKWNMLMEQARPVFGTDLDPYDDFSTRDALTKDSENFVTSVKDVDGRTSVVSYPESDPSAATVTPLGTGVGTSPYLPYKDAKQKADVEAKVRTEFTALTKDYRKVRDAYRRVQASGADPSAAGDLALIFNYMKILDPGSTVREGEFANAQNSGGVSERVQAMYNSVLRGERLSTAIRADFMDRSHRLFATQNEQYEKTRADFSARSKRMDLDEANVLPDFGSAVSEESVLGGDLVKGTSSDGRAWTGRR